MAIGGGLWAAILGYCFTFYNAQVQEQRKARLERVNQQLKDLYGPLLACVTATKSAYEAMVRQHSPDGSRQALQSALLARPYGPEAHAFRLWMTSVLQPLNERAAAIVQGGFSLLEGVALEPQLLQLVAHVSASRVVLERWAQGELATGSAISYPDKLEGMVRQEFARLKARQAELLGVTTPKAERLANKHAECSAPMHAPSSACDTSSGHGPDSVESCVEGDSSRCSSRDPNGLLVPLPAAVAAAAACAGAQLQVKPWATVQRNSCGREQLRGGMSWEGVQGALAGAGPNPISRPGADSSSESSTGFTPPRQGLGLDVGRSRL